MVEYPPLVFPEPTRASRAKLSGGGSAIEQPSAQRQAARLAPQFDRLQHAIQNRSLALKGNPFGIQPELALVLETFGPVDDFLRVVRNIKGLSWLGELDVEEIQPQYGFHDRDHEEKLLSGRLYLVMTDYRALQELQALFTGWQKNPAAKLPKGLAPLKKAFAQLSAIRPWDMEDRIRDTGLLEDWQDRVAFGDMTVPVEVELWFRESSDRRTAAESAMQQVVTRLGGKIIGQCVIPEISYHAILGQIPVGVLPGLVTETSQMRDFALLQCEDAMYLRPVGQCAIPISEDLEETGIAEDLGQGDGPEGEPIVALLDGLPLSGHRLINGRVIIDDPEDFETAYLSSERSHGTAMASLICLGDLSEAGQPLSRPVYVRPIMKPRRGFGALCSEVIPEDVLPVDLVHRAVRRLFESDGSELPAAPSVRVISLSICDSARPFVREMSPLARLLDWLSWKYNILFLVSAGNHGHDLTLDVPREDLGRLTPDRLQSAVVRAIAADTRHRRILSPAETLNGITVGAAHDDSSTADANNSLIDPFGMAAIPSTYSAHGPGYRRSIKPDLLLPGGRQFLSPKLGTTHTYAILRTKSFGSSPGQRVAYPGQPGELDRTIYTRGTSNATALASRWAHILFDMLERLRSQSDSIVPAEYDAVLLKTLLVHGADWGDLVRIYECVLKNSDNSRSFADYVGHFLGYGLIDAERALGCTDQRAMVLGFGRLDAEGAHVYHLPLPPSLSALAEKRRLTITLAWMSPVSSTSRKYRVAHLWFDPKNEVAGDRMCADHSAVRRGTVQHEILEGKRAVDFQDGDTITITVNCRSDAEDIPEPIRYGLAVTVEVADELGLPIYQQVRDRLRVRIPIQGNSTA